MARFLGSGQEDGMGLQAHAAVGALAKLELRTSSCIYSKLASHQNADNATNLSLYNNTL
jgi:hypothetical protein